jgi:hypothetical protein
MSNSAASLLEEIDSALKERRVSLARLGPAAGSAEVLSLDAPEAMRQYAQMMTPQIHGALANNRRVETLLIVLIVLLFLVACGLTVVGHYKGWNWTTSVVAIPGVGATCVWPIRRLTRLRKENIQLELLPLLLPLLTPGDARDVVRRFLDIE